ncbi:MAG: T9SS type A sorting domain-containing protein, partial [Saprospiraceae bacterium]
YLSWMAEEWPVGDASGVNQQTVDIAPIIQEIVDEVGYTAGSSIVILIDGIGTRTAEAYDGDADKAAELCIEYDLTGTTTATINSDENKEKEIVTPPTNTISSLHIFPNPAKDYLTLRFNPHSVDRESTIQIWDSNGRLVRNEKREITAGQNEVRLDDLSLPNGNYIIQLYRNPFMKAAKFVVYK